MWKVSVIVRYEALKSKLFSASSLFVLGLNCSVRRWRHYLGSKCQLCNRILGPSISLMEKVLERRTPQLSSVGLWCVWTDWNGKSHGNVPRSFVQWANLHTLYQLLHRQAMFSDNNQNWALSRWILMPLTSPLMVLVLQGFLFGMLMVPLSSPGPMVDHLASMLAAEATAATDCLQLVLSWRHHKVILKSN